MIFSIYDAVNLMITLLLLCYIGIKFQFSNRVMFILLLHLSFVACFDLLIPLSYIPDQYRYYPVSMYFRGSETYTFEKGNVYFAGMFFSFFPLFIASVKSIAFINYLIYLFMFVFILSRLKSKKCKIYFKIFYLLYPSLFLYSSLGLRDMLITAFMFAVLYNIFFVKNKIVQWAVIVATLYCLMLIKFQNSLLLGIVILTNIVSKIYSKKIRMCCYVVLIGIAILSYVFFHDSLDFYRRAMYYEDTGLPIYTMSTWSPFDLYRFYLAPFFIDARNGFQLIQSCENVLLIYFAIKVIKLKREFIMGNNQKIFMINCFFVFASIIYSYVVFNYGTITRYKLPFVVCWFIITFLIYDKQQYKSDNQE